MKTKITKKGYLIKKKNFNEKELNDIKNSLIVSPANYYTGTVKQEIISFPVYQEDDKHLIIPKFYGIKKFGKPKKNKEKDGLETKLKFKGKLRDYQKEISDVAIKHISEEGGGVISLGCGQGKTVLALFLACHFKVKTLVIVHKTFLLNQWIERAKQFTNATLGIIQQNKVDTDKDIVIGMLQSIAKDKYSSKIFKEFGFVIFDEAHHAPSQYFSKALPIINCKKTLALTATPKRADKLEKILYWYFGDMIYQAEKVQNKNVVVNIINYSLKDKNFKEYKLPFNGKVNKPKTITKITELKKRNDFILEIIKTLSDNKLRQILILSDRLEHLKTLSNLLETFYENVEQGFYIGGMKQEKLDISAKKKIIFASYGMASEALDIPSLNTLILTTPRSQVEQSVGRILRKKTHKVKPLIIDIVDNLKSFKNQSNTRKRLYKKMDYQIIEKIYENNKLIETKDITKKNFGSKFNPDLVDFI